jgi:peptidoglycan hydrolase-like protein with peptidoglycan-binding domain
LTALSVALRQPSARGRPVAEGGSEGRPRKRGWKIAVDGTYGPPSEKVCRAFQEEKHLGVDGIVGPKTWAAAWTAPSA